MTTIAALKKEIAGAGYFNAEQKKWLLNGIDKALNSITVVDAAKPRKIRNVKTGTNLLTLEQWEAARGKELHFTDFKDWIFKTGLIEYQVRVMIEEFRAEMQAKGKQYANFKMAFQTYLTKGYLSKKFRECLAENNATVIHTRGINL